MGKKNNSILKIGFSLLAGVAIGYIVGRNKETYFELNVEKRVLTEREINLLSKKFTSLGLDDIESIFKLYDSRKSYSREYEKIIYRNVVRMEAKRLELEKETKQASQLEVKIKDKHPEAFMADIDSEPSEEIVYRTKSGTKYHKEDCPNLRSEIPLKLSKAKEDGLTPCSICHVER